MSETGHAFVADTALRLGRYFDTGPEFWLNLQSLYDLAIAEEKAPGIKDIQAMEAA